MSAPRLSICAPAYDEEECIEDVVRSWLAMLDETGLEAEIVVANDGSRDRTGEILARLAAQDPRVRVSGAATNGGYGVALRRAVADARGELVVTIDSDGQFDPADIPRLLQARDRGGFDLVNGRRAKNDTVARVAADHALRLWVRGLLGVRVRDPNCALKVVPRAWMVAADLRAVGYPTPTEIVAVAAHDGLRIGELDVAHLDRRGGRTKLRLLRTAAGAALFLLGLRRRLSREARAGSAGPERMG